LTSSPTATTEPGVVDVPRQLADVDETVHATEVDEGAELTRRRHHTLADLARLQVVEEVVARSH
jgi:hypothetical protein